MSSCSPVLRGDGSEPGAIPSYLLLIVVLVCCNCCRRRRRRRRCRSCRCCQCSCCCRRRYLHIKEKQSNLLVESPRQKSRQPATVAAALYLDNNRATSAGRKLHDSRSPRIIFFSPRIIFFSEHYSGYYSLDTPAGFLRFSRPTPINPESRRKM